ncbi:hypothetical protein [Legionella moravica]|nr:hypothetical protein [Legionella moravica]
MNYNLLIVNTGNSIIKMAKTPNIPHHQWGQALNCELYRFFIGKWL